MRWLANEDWERYEPPGVVGPELLGGIPPSDPTGVEVPPRAESDLWVAWRGASDASARNELVERYLGFARAIAATMYGRGCRNSIGFEDYRQFALVGLLEAIDRYDPGRGAKFKTFAGPRIRGAVLNGLAHLTEHQEQVAMRRRLESERITSLVPASGLADGDGLLAQLGEIGVTVALGFILDGLGLGAEGRDPSEGDPYAQVELQQVRTQVRELVDRLPAVERTTIELHYGRAIRFDLIAAELGVSAARVSQIHRQAIDRLRRFISKAKGCDLAY